MQTNADLKDERSAPPLCPSFPWTALEISRRISAIDSDGRSVNCCKKIVGAREMSEGAIRNAEPPHATKRAAHTPWPAGYPLADRLHVDLNVYGSEESCSSAPRNTSSNEAAKLFRIEPPPGVGGRAHSSGALPRMVIARARWAGRNGEMRTGRRKLSRDI